MASLLDVAPLTIPVMVGGANGAVTLTVSGLSAAHIAMLFHRFPDLRKLFSGMNADMDALMNAAPDCLAAILAAGCGAAGDPANEQAAANLPAEAQADILAAILKLTLPGGLGPFVEKLSTLPGIIGVAGQSGEALGTKSRKQ